MRVDVVQIVEHGCFLPTDAGGARLLNGQSPVQRPTKPAENKGAAIVANNESRNLKVSSSNFGRRVSAKPGRRVAPNKPAGIVGQKRQRFVCRRSIEDDMTSPNKIG